MNQDRSTRINARQVADLVTAGKLNEPDWDIAWALYRHRFLSTTQVYRLLFAGGVGEATGRYRLRKLYSLSIVDRLRLPRERMRSEGLQPGFVYTLGEGGRIWVSRTLEAEGEDRAVRSLKTGQAATGHPLLVHDLVQNEFALRMVEEARRREYTVEWLGEWEATESFEWDGRRRLFRPDGALDIEQGEKTLFAYIEMDMGKRAHRRTTKKVPMYERYFRSKAWQTRFDKFPLVLVVTSTEERRRRLMQAMERAQRERDLRWLHASREVLWQSLIGPVWKMQDREVALFRALGDAQAPAHTDLTEEG